MNKGWLVSVATNGDVQRSTTMRIKLTYIAPLLAAGAAAVAIAAAPTAAAANVQTCSGVICQSPGNGQINNAPPPFSTTATEACPFCSALTAAFPAAWADTQRNHSSRPAT